MAKKGDVIGGRLEVTGISSDEVEILDREKGEIVKKIIEKNSFAKQT